MIQKANKNIPRRNKYILENILLNIFKFYILKCTIKFLQMHGNNKKKFDFHNFAEHRLRTSGVEVYRFLTKSKLSYFEIPSARYFFSFFATNNLSIFVLKCNYSSSILFCIIINKNFKELTKIYWQRYR